ncbi:MAG: gluconate 2-dehydrogenase subunit 3 family protein [Cyclobacteriaceae bacterium]|nr:gluconate 2-dehydrogenase subunit 3 family protein [Cyclobacteriaceae bacterium SS2]
MDRRTALKQSALMAGAFALLPSCNFGPDRELVALDNLQIDLDHQDLLAKVIETIIPSTEAEPGAEALNLYRFVLVMVDDCEPKETQQVFVDGLKKFKALVKNKVGQSFPQKEQQANEEILTAATSLEGLSAEEQPVQEFLAIARRYTIQGYMGSKHYLTEKFPYQLVPGPYQDCVNSDGLIVM